MKTLTKICPVCNREYVIEAYREKRNKYCSQPCMGKGVNTGRRVTWGAKIGEKLRGIKRPYLSEWNRNNPKPGSLNPAWKGGVTSINQRGRKRLYTIKWSQQVFQRDDYTCRMCHKRGGDLEAHHIFRFRDYPELRDKIENGVTLCRLCHYKTRGKESKYIKRFTKVLTTLNEEFK